jgi:hypothetical protein
LETLEELIARCQTTQALCQCTQFGGFKKFHLIQGLTVLQWQEILNEFPERSVHITRPSCACFGCIKVKIGPNYIVWESQ